VQGQSKSKCRVLRSKFYNKTIDLIEKESVGKSIGSHCSLLLGTDQNANKKFYDELCMSWVNGMSRFELSNYFSKERPITLELSSVEGQ
jgi:hypothetical protein